MYKVFGASLETNDITHDFVFDTPRQFQADFVEWVHTPENGKRCCVLQAPTGGGKTATFTSFAENCSQTLIVYPTNSLIKQQSKTLEELGLDVKILTAKSLQKKGPDRVDELLAHVKPPYSDVVITNPDILGAVIQGSYVDPSGKSMEFFDNFDGVIYDEFHYYSPFSASGLFIQANVILNRSPKSRIVFSSATPREDYLLFLEDFLSTDIERITSNYDDGGQVFREQMSIQQNTKTMWESRTQILDTLEDVVSNVSSYSGPRVVLLFNSAKDSNEFYRWLGEESAAVFNVCEKDNGYDTYWEGEIEPNDSLILVTTSKGEVGLDYDIKWMFMDVPYEYRSFIQRIGRAGRKSPAEVGLYNMDAVNWPEEMEYTEFLDVVDEYFHNSESPKDTLRDLTAIRAASAYLDKQTKKSDRELEYFTQSPKFRKWLTFVSNIYEQRDKIQSGSIPPYKTPSKAYKKLIELLYRGIRSFNSLRGSSNTVTIRYSRGREIVKTEYGLISAITQGVVDNVQEEQDETIVTMDFSENTDCTVSLAGFSDISLSYSGVYDLIDCYNDDIIPIIDGLESELENADIRPDLVRRYFSVTPYDISLPITQIEQGNNRFKLYD